MAAAAMSARLPLARHSSRQATGSVAFDECGGPVVAVCGLTGGAGTTTLALLLARHAAAASTAPVLITEPQAGRGLAVHAGRATSHSLEALASRAAVGDAPEGAFAELESGLRLVATTERTVTRTDVPVGALIEQARDAHGLVVIDCGTTWSADDPMLGLATHRIWVLPATPVGIATARLVLPPRAGVAVAVARDPHVKVPVRAVRRALRGRCDRLVLVPYSEQLAGGEHSADESIAHAIVALTTSVRRNR